MGVSDGQVEGMKMFIMSTSALKGLYTKEGTSSASAFFESGAPFQLNSRFFVSCRSPHILVWEVEEDRGVHLISVIA